MYNAIVPYFNIYMNRKQRDIHPLRCLPNLFHV